VWYVVFSPTNPNSETQSRDLQEVARKLALQLHTPRASTERDLDTVFVTVAQLRAGALLIGGDAFFASRSGQIAALAARHAIPTISFMRSFGAAGSITSSAPTSKLGGTVNPSIFAVLRLMISLTFVL
jgi:putative tryptophan/tyrosine transport system substrate-binding protein